MVTTLLSTEGEAGVQELSDQQLQQAKLERVRSFDIGSYIPYQVVFSEMLMYRVGRADQHPNITSIAPISQGESRVLSFVHLGRAASPSDLTEKLSMDRALVTRNITSLEKKGLIAITKDPKDLRRKLLALTELGERVAIELVDLYAIFNQYLESVLSKSERQTLLKTLGKLNNACHEFPGFD